MNHFVVTNTKTRFSEKEKTDDGDDEDDVFKRLVLNFPEADEPVLVSAP